MQKGFTWHIDVPLSNFGTLLSHLDRGLIRETQIRNRKIRARCYQMDTHAFGGVFQPGL